MPSEHAPEKRKIQTLKLKIQTGRTRARPGYEGRELTEEELQLAALEEKREQGIRDRKVAKDTLDNAEQLKLGQAEILDAVRTGFASVHDRMDPIIAPAGSSENLRQQARVAAKREREADKERKLLHEGLVQENGDEYHGEVLVKAGSEVDQGRDLNATITVGGMRCRLVLLDRAQAWVQLLPPANLDQLKARDADFRYSGVVMRAHHKGTTFSNLRWKDRGTQLVDGEDAKVPKQAIIRLILDKANIMAKLPRAEERPAKRRAVEAEPEDTEGEPDVEMSDKSAEEPDVEMKPADEDLESTAASSSGVELWEMALGGSTARFSVDRVTGFSPLGRERLITPVKEDLAAFKAFRHQGLREVPDGQYLLSARLWNESVTKASSPTVSADSFGGARGGSPGRGARAGSPGSSPGGARGGSPGSSPGSLGSSLGGARGSSPGGSSDLPVWRGGARGSGWLRDGRRGQLPAEGVHPAGVSRAARLCPSSRKGWPMAAWTSAG